ncbi:hypothetical protein DSCW_36410 [Desulfosarcina widdelii]|uniref:Uncharacterized protein n=1 Tax=Desulfosarcina widdelii TaxID=947919 RepID=A0A5K7ZCP0_9BACT|nr:hypothetical protein DSCW_36410 [Desulfosarcina widdelii]
MAADVILTVIVNGLPAIGAIPDDFILEKLEAVSAIFARYIENRVGSPFLGVVSGTFSHV